MSHYLINSPHVIADDFEGETVIVNLITGGYFSLQGQTATIFPLLSSGVPINQIVDNFKNQDTIPKDVMNSDLTFFAKKLVELEILVESEQPPKTPEQMEPIAYERPSISIYDDLEDIIKVDPIHEVNPDIGWPDKSDAIK